MSKENYLNEIRDVVKVQTSNGNWNYDPYMHGMANGMILCLALMEGKEPVFLDAPEKWVRKDANK